MADEISIWTNYVTEEFNHIFHIDLWKNFPTDQVIDLEKQVHDNDSFKSRLTSLSTFFDNLNKRAFDKVTGHNEAGTRLSLIALLKFELQDYHPQIDTLFETVHMINLLRTHYVHVGNKNYREALKFFAIPEPLTDYQLAWTKIRLKFELFLADFSDLIKNKNAVPLKQAHLVQETVETMFRNTLKGYSHYLKDEPLVKLMLREIAVQGQLTDTELAAMVKHPVEEIRTLLLPLTDSFLRVTYATDQSTMITIRKFQTELQALDYWLTKNDEA